MASDQLTEQEVQFRKRARRRLIGAIALVLLMITILPMVLDDQDAKAPQPDIAISIPSQDGAGFTSKIVPVAPSEQPTPPVATPPVATLTEPVASAKTQPAAPEVQLAPPLEKPAAQELPKPSPQAAAPAPEKAEAAPKPVADVATKPASTKPEASPKAAPATKPANGKSGFSVQVGVFSEAAKVKKLQEKLAAQGIKTYTEKISTSTGSKIRLRSGPFASRAEAEAVRDKLKAAGMTGMVVANK